MKSAIRVAAAAAVTAGLAAVIVLLVPLERIGEAFRAFDPVWLAPLAACYAATFLLRAVRFRVLGLALPLPTLFGVVAVYQLMVRLMPLRSGEAALPILVRRLAGVPLAHGVAAVLLSHLLDLAAVAAAALAALAAAPDIRATIGPAGTVLIAAALAAMAGGYYVLPAVAGRLAAWLGRRLRAKRPATAGRFDRAAATLAEVRSISRRAAAAAALWTALTWICAFGCFWAAAVAVGIDAGPAHVMFGAAVGVLGGILPIGGVGSFGTLEGAWAAGFTLVGVASGPAVASALVMSGSSLACAALVAGAWVVLRTKPASGQGQ